MLRFRWLALLLCAMTLSCQTHAIAAYSVWNSECIKDPNSDEWKNIESAAAFIRKMGDDAVADNIIKMLKNHDIYWDPTLPENGDTSVTGDITINKSLIHHSKAAGPKKYQHPFDPDSDFLEVLELARTLFHEKVHVHQSCFFKAVSNVCDDGNAHESEAWGK